MFRSDIYRVIPTQEFTPSHEMNYSSVLYLKEITVTTVHCAERGLHYPVKLHPL